MLTGNLSHAQGRHRTPDLGANHFDRRSVDTKAKRFVGQLTNLGF
jgi:hypothetical protein